MIYFDLDGVLRDLCGRIGVQPKHYYQKFMNGLTITEIIDRDLCILGTANPTKYHRMVATLPITVMTCQPINYIPWTQYWLDRHLPNAKVLFCQHPLEKLDQLTPGDLLVEDYPFFPDNSQIVLIDQSYNQDVVGCYCRVKKPDELKSILTKGGTFNVSLGKTFRAVRDHHETLYQDQV